MTYKITCVNIKLININYINIGGDSMNKSLMELVIENNLTQEELAHRMNVTQGAISQWINGISTPRLYNLNKLAQILSCSISDIVNCFKKS